MIKHPLRYTSNDLKEILFKPIEICIGPVQSDDVNRVIKCEIIKYNHAANSPHQPVDIVVKVDNQAEELLNISEVKSFKLL
ncbi:hypothetical protein K5X82_15720 [Halosquirtibacter xylanolyticus]|uniref:hypothetical protein n=1 Tax=Halosquirtibacter xylanolyticus TaxID=3374599 RepID=UPI00374880E0|nr:hypothetical protein K5X82_15720 [Prolixibacteraceae bacterium]